jgi:hypothetical protein
MLLSVFDASPSGFVIMSAVGGRRLIITKGTVQREKREESFVDFVVRG